MGRRLTGVIVSLLGLDLTEIGFLETEKMKSLSSVLNEASAHDALNVAGLLQTHKLGSRPLPGQSVYISSSISSADHLAITSSFFPHLIIEGGGSVEYRERATLIIDAYVM